MDDTRFDALARSLGAASSRRRALGGLLAGTLGILGWHDGDESAAHVIKCQNKSGEAKKKCKQKAKKHKKQHASETPPTGGGGGGVQPPGPCDGKPNDSACNGDGKCLNGVCNPKPQCTRVGDFCSTGGECCSGGCDTSTINECLPRSNITTGAANGSQCLSGDDCTSGFCLGYRCQGSICNSTADYCANGTPTCGDGGFCVQPVERPGARCGVQPPPYNASCGCAVDEQCINAYGPGAFCAKDTGIHCSCANGATNFCAVPR